MSKKILLFVLIAFQLTAQKTPKEFFGYELGTEFTYHHLLVDYAKHLASSLPQNAKWVSYGKTNERRELGQLIICSPGILPKLEEIRKTHLEVVEGKISKQAASGLPVIVNLSFNVHGNEAAGSEAAMGLLYDLISNYANLSTWSNNKPFILLIDPCINPDGRDTYVTQYNRKNYFKGGNEDPLDQEHFEGKVSGRYNHFLHDLNRDWAWQTQIETQQRIPFFQSYMPMLHADFHEQSGQHSYYFPPAAKPYLNLISAGTKDLQESLGKSFANLFDRNGWTYFTSEVYDLLYPSYGDTYPILNGALGMTLEQGGIRAGLSQKLNNGDTLRFTERVNHHRMLANELVKWSLNNADALKNTFYQNHENARQNPSNQYKTYIIPQNQIAKSRALLDILQKNKIVFGKAGKAIESTAAYSYLDAKNVAYKGSSEDILISAYQRSAPLAQVFLDPIIALEDSLTYDITAWNLFQIHGIKAYATKEKYLPTYEMAVSEVKNSFDANALGYYLKPANASEMLLVERAKKAGFDVVFNDLPLESKGKKIEPGTFFIFSKNKKKNLQSFVNQATEQQVSLEPIYSFRFEKGADLGSEHFKFYQPSKAVVLVGDNFDVNQIGELAYFFATHLKVKASFVPFKELLSRPMDHYTHVFVPAANQLSFEESDWNALSTWVGNGGNLILFEQSITKLPASVFSFVKGYKELKDTSETTVPYANRERNELSYGLSGNVLEVIGENTHPFLFRGAQEKTFILNTAGMLFKTQPGVPALLKTSSSPYFNGFMGYKMKKLLPNTTWLTTHDMGKGKITWFNFNPLFRSIPTLGQTILENILLYHTY